MRQFVLLTRRASHVEARTAVAADSEAEARVVAALDGRERMQVTRASGFPERDAVTAYYRGGASIAIAFPEGRLMSESELDSEWLNGQISWLADGLPVRWELPS